VTALAQRPDHRPGGLIVRGQRCGCRGDRRGRIISAAQRNAAKLAVAASGCRSSSSPAPRRPSATADQRRRRPRPSTATRLPVSTPAVPCGPTTTCGPHATGTPIGTPNRCCLSLDIITSSPPSMLHRQRRGGRGLRRRRRFAATQERVVAIAWAAGRNSPATAPSRVHRVQQHHGQPWRPGRGDGRGNVIVSRSTTSRS
jgi:hypothetical protein